MVDPVGLSKTFEEILPQPDQQSKTKQNTFGWYGIIIGKKPTTTTTTPPQCDYILNNFQATWEAEFCIT